MPWAKIVSLIAKSFCVLGIVAVLGCTGAETSAPKKELTDKDKEQIRQLNEQRASEWSSTKRK